MALCHIHVEVNSWTNCIISNKRAPLYGPSGILCSSRHDTCCHLHPLTYCQISHFDCKSFQRVHFVSTIAWFWHTSSANRVEFPLLYSHIIFLVREENGEREIRGGGNRAALLLYSPSMDRIEDNVTTTIILPNLLCRPTTWNHTTFVILRVGLRQKL